MSITFVCPSCNASLQAPEAYANRSARCKHCGAAVRIPPLLGASAEGQPGAPAASSALLSPPPPRPGTLPSHPAGEAAGSPYGQRLTLAAAASVSAAERHRPKPQHPVLRFQFTHSGLARVMGGVAVVLFAMAVVAQAYTFWQVNWEELRTMPFELAVPLLALSVVPGSALALLGVFSLAVGHALEYLARIAAQYT